MKKITFYLLVLVFVIGCGQNGQNSDENNSSTTETTQETKMDAKETVNEFISSLGAEDYQKAYDLTKNPKWGSYEKFSSPKAFGGISKTTIYEIKIVESSKSEATVYADVEYIDKVNGNSRFKQNFYLKKDEKNWKIVNMKLVKNDDEADTDNSETSDEAVIPYQNVYSDGSVFFVIYTDVDGRFFEGFFVDTENLIYDEVTVELKNNKWYSSDFSVAESVELIFVGDEKLTLKSDNGKLDRTISTDIELDYPKKGEYSYESNFEQGVVVIEDFSSYYNYLNFNVFVGTESGCTGELEKASAKGTYGVYAYESNTDGLKCKLVLIFSEGKVKVVEIPPCDYHGANCSFSGVYEYKGEN